MLRLSDATFGSSSVAAVGVAAHECGHAIQDAQGYAPLKIRGALVPVANLGATLSWPLVLIGLLIMQKQRDDFYQSRYYSLLCGGFVSACDSAGGVQCVQPGVAAR